MPSITRTLFLLGVVLVVAMPAVVHAQNATIPVSATVQPRPVMLIDAELTPVAGELRVRLDGCGGGALSVDVRTADSTRRSSRSVLETSTVCATRTVLLQLPTSVPGALDFIVTLEQTQSLVSPAFAQFVIRASTLGGRSAVAY